MIRALLLCLTLTACDFSGAIGQLIVGAVEAAKSAGERKP